MQFHIRDLADYLARHGHEPSVLAPADEGTVLPEHVVPAGRAVPIRYNGSTARLLFGPVASARVGRWLEEGDFDVVHIHEPLAPSLSVLALWAATSPVVATFHTSNVRSRVMQAAYPLLRPSLEKIHGRIAVSEDARRTVTTHIGGDAVVIPNGVDTSAFARAERDPRWTGAPGRPTIVFLGRIDEPRKGLPVLAEAMPAVLDAVPGARLLVVGPGSAEAARAKLPEAVAASTEFLGALSDEDKASALASADLYIAPHTGERASGSSSSRRWRPAHPSSPATWRPSRGSSTRGAPVWPEPSSRASAPRTSPPGSSSCSATQSDARPSRDWGGSARGPSTGTSSPARSSPSTRPSSTRGTPAR